MVEIVGPPLQDDISGNLGLLEYIDGALTVSHATGMNVAEVAVSVAKVTVDIIEASAPHKPADHNDLA